VKRESRCLCFVSPQLNGYNPHGVQWRGKPEQVLDKLSFIRDKINMNAVMCHFSYAGMPYDEAERNMHGFTKHFLPELKKWQTTPLTEPKELAISAV
jgi:hypothetical protein